MVPERLQLALDMVNRCVQIGSFIGTSGVSLNWYADLRGLAFEKSFFRLFHDFVFDQVDKTFDTVGGLGYAGSLFTAQMMFYPGRFSAFGIREPKEHGSKTGFYGKLGSGNIILVDDVLTTGTSVIKAVQFLRQYSPQLASAKMRLAVILDRQAGGRQAVEELGVQVFPLLLKEQLNIPISP